jgi:hypothetical protein
MLIRITITNISEASISDGTEQSLRRGGGEDVGAGQSQTACYRGGQAPLSERRHSAVPVMAAMSVFSQ